MQQVTFLLSSFWHIWRRWMSLSLAGLSSSVPMWGWAVCTNHSSAQAAGDQSEAAVATFPRPVCLLCTHHSRSLQARAGHTNLISADFESSSNKIRTSKSSSPFFISSHFTPFPPDLTLLSSQGGPALARCGWTQFRLPGSALKCPGLQIPTHSPAPRIGRYGSRDLNTGLWLAVCKCA